MTKEFEIEKCELCEECDNCILRQMDKVSICPLEKEDFYREDISQERN